MSKVWLITGSARGLGRDILEAALKAGASVLATARDPARLDDLKTAHGGRLETFALDVTDAPAAVRAATRELLDEVEGTVGVISAMARRDEVMEWLAALDPALDDEPRLRVMGRLEAKGLEFDAVVLVEPDELLGESPTGRRTLYVALTRATQRLTVLGSTSDWVAPAAA